MEDTTVENTEATTTPTGSTWAVSPSVDNVQEPTIEQRLATMEARLVELEKTAHSGHTILPETMEQIAQHTIQRVKEHLAQILGKSA
jgi:hypothetical protein